MTRPPPEDSGPPGPFASLVAQMDDILGLDLPAARHLGPPEVTGQLDQTHVGLLVGSAFQRAFSGSLTLIDDSGARGIVWFDAGRPVDVVLGDTSPGERASATAAEVERWFLAVASWRAGRFVWSPFDRAGQPHRTLALRHPAALVHESLRREGAEPLRRWLGEDANRATLRHDGTALELIEVAVSDATVASSLRLFDGRRSYADVASATPLDKKTLLRAMFVLFAFGALDFANDDSDGLPVVIDPQPVTTERARVGVLHALAQQSDYFTFLGIDRSASRTEVLTAVARLAREIDQQNLHPDVALATGRERAIISDVLSEAVRILGDEGLRVRYREALGPTSDPVIAEGKLAAINPRP